MNFEEGLVSWLFETDALRVCPEKKPFFYTSGTIGPYYINTHFLYGGQRPAEELLGDIDGYLNDRGSLSEKIARRAFENYQAGGVYQKLMDGIALSVKHSMDLREIDYISGGERRDWFFSLEAARLLNKPHITLFKDGEGLVFNPQGLSLPDLSGASVLHISDLITEASSYERAWIPALEGMGAKMAFSLSVVDRLQGGSGLLSSHGVRHISLIGVENSLFERALEMKKITRDQYDMIAAYLKNPAASMAAFLKGNREFLENALRSDERTRARAKLLVESGVYDI